MVSEHYCQRQSVKKLPFYCKQIYKNSCYNTGNFVFLRMQHITGISRHQMRFSSLEDAISADNQVRFIDAFVMCLDFSKLGFTTKTLKSHGRPSYDPKCFPRPITMVILMELGVPENYKKNGLGILRCNGYWETFVPTTTASRVSGKRIPLA